MQNSGALHLAHLRRLLQLCLPGVSVFLDVDDLKASCQMLPTHFLHSEIHRPKCVQVIGDLESYIEQSAAVLIFLSTGYFASRNCKAHPASPP